MSPSTRCRSIVPPYVLETLAANAEPEVAERARVALAHDRELRWARRARQMQLPAPGAPAPGAPAPSVPGAAEAGTAATPHRTVSDAHGEETTPGTAVRGEGDPATGDPAADEAYDGLGSTWQLWWQAYGRDSLDGKGLPLLATVHYGTRYDNAFWDGAQMVFGDGDGVIFQRFTKSIDVIGHELAHGVTEHTAGLLYQGQSGALNESVSDVFGALVEQHAKGQSAADASWLIGADLLAPGVAGRALRDMHNPGTAYDDPRLGKDPQPASMDGYVETTDDNGGVHVNSGIPNRAFTLAALAIGGNAWEGAGAIWYAVLTGDGIKADCDFATFAGLTVDAAVAAHGDGSAQHLAVRDAWVTVGVLAPPAEQGGGPAGAEEPGPSPAPGGTADVGSGAADGPMGEVPDVGAQVLLRRTGGFAGLVRERQLLLSELPESDAMTWQQLLARPTLQAIAADPTTHPDAYSYTVVCESAGVEVHVAEPHLPEAIHQLFERTLGEG
ncbi:MAG TPA: protealysin inhibitor emfourin [Intrasporangium sp.]|uniref:protealysin inhibitor emfourin n=1 Tax=Intrasporangium sp. TaxID=1925024 RepID=UPI002D77027F|nr:protealysin inhibitor emfourin [Intrasporangium sp.]HET7399036.1 protealysin inhibitor emfourin [Intrasporangium sp.]